MAAFTGPVLSSNYFYKNSLRMHTHTHTHTAYRCAFSIRGQVVSGFAFLQASADDGLFSRWVGHVKQEDDVFIALNNKYPQLHLVHKGRARPP